MGTIDTAKYILKQRFAFWLDRNDYSSLKKFENIHLGEECYIVATGPSLLIDDLDRLHADHKICFSMNSCIKLFGKTSWRPDYYVLSDYYVYESLKKDIPDEHEIPVFFHPRKVPYVGNNSFAFKLSSIGTELRATKIHKFVNVHPRVSDDVTKYVSDGNSVVFIILQLAAYMGFQTIYLLGTDCNYKVAHTKLTDYHYTPKRRKETLGNEIIDDYIIFDKFAKERKIQILTATRGGMLEVFPRVNADDVL